MFESAVDVSEDVVDQKAQAQRPFHFDLVGLAQGLHKSASVAAHVNKLRKHVSDAKAALKTHQGHLQDIQDLL